MILVNDLQLNNYYFQHFKWLQQHIVHKHEKSKPWKCEDCDYAHSLLAGLKRHKKTKHPDESTMKVCHICGHKAVTNQGNLLNGIVNNTVRR